MTYLSRAGRAALATTISMRILLFYRDIFQPGGMPRETQLMAQFLKSEGVDVVLAGTEGPRPSPEAVLETALVWPRHWIRLNAAVHRLLATEHQTDAAVLVGGRIPENILVARVLRQAHVPYVVSPSDIYSPALYSGVRGKIKSLYNLLVEDPYMLRSAGIRCYSVDHQDQLKARFSGYRGTWCIIKEGIDPQFKGKTHRLDVGREFRVGYLGRLDVVTKGLDILIAAWRRFVEGGASGQLLIAGPSGRGWDALRDEAISLGVQVIPALSRDEVPSFLARLSVLVIPSRHEGIPRVAREALAVGTPIVVTAGTNLRDTVRTTGSGWTVDLDGRELGNLLSTLAQDPPLREAARAATARARNELSWARIAADWKIMLGRIVEGSQNPREAT